MSHPSFLSLAVAALLLSTGAAPSAAAADPAAFAVRYALQCEASGGLLLNSAAFSTATLDGTVTGTVAPYVEPGGEVTVRDLRFTLGHDRGYASSIERWFDPLVDRVSGALTHAALRSRHLTPASVDGVTGAAQAIAPAPVGPRRWDDIRVIGSAGALTVGPFAATAGAETIRVLFDRVSFDLTGTSTLIRGLVDRVSFSCRAGEPIGRSGQSNDLEFATIPVVAAGTGVPAIASLGLTRGGTAGGQTVRIAGPGLGAATEVRFAGTAARFERVSDSVIEAVSPPHAEGAVRVTVTTAQGTTADAPRDDFTYVVPKLISSVGTGRSTGGTFVSVYGADLETVTGVTFDGVPGTGFKQYGGYSISVLAPAGAAGRTADVRLVSPSGSTGAGTLTWQLGELEPTSGDIAGGTPVTVLGLDTAGMVAIEFGEANPATDFETVDADTATGVSPPEPWGPVQAVYADGRRVTVLEDFGRENHERWTLLTGLSPEVGPVSGGNTITLAGEYLGGLQRVWVGGRDAAFEVQPDGRSAKVVVPPSTSPGKVQVTASGFPFPAISLRGDQPDYIYAVQPVIREVTPARLWAYTSKVIRLNGSGLAGVRTVKIGSRRVRPSVVGDGSVLVAVPALAPGTYPVTVSGRTGDSAVSGAPTITYRSLTPTR